MIAPTADDILTAERDARDHAARACRGRALIERAADAAADAVLRAARDFDPARGTAFAHMAQVYAAQAIRLTRRRWRNPACAQLPDEKDLADARPGIPDVDLTALPPEVRAVVTLRVVQGYSLVDTALLRGTSTVTVKVLLRRAAGLMGVL